MKRGKRKGCVLFMLLIIFILFLSCSFFISAQQGQEAIKIKKAYSWLKSRSIGRWQNLDTEQHVFSLLALKDRLSDLQIDSSKRKLLDKSFENGTCWPEIACKGKETALAKLALDMTGGETGKTNEWLLNQTAMPSGIDWYLQITIENAPARCLLFYDNADYEISIDKEDKLGGNPGPCFTIAENYWLSLSQECSDKTFNVSCNESVMANFLFKKGTDWYVTGQLEQAPAQGLLSIGLKTLCITTLGLCNYEASLWTAYAFFKQGRLDISRFFLPYLVMNYENTENQKFLPQAFLYEMTKKQGYATELEDLQRIDGLWLGEGSFDRYYNTGLVVLMTHRMIGNITKTKETLLEEQKDGSWGCAGCDPVRDTALVLWGVWPTYEWLSECEKEGYSCVMNCTASGGERVGYSCFENHECCNISLTCEQKWGSCRVACLDNETQVPYACDSGKKCCKPYDKSLCVSEIGGKICGTGQKCLDNLGNIIPFITSSEGPVCCLGVCETASQTCLDAGGEYCDPAQGKSCQGNNWIQAVDTLYCCKSGFCITQPLTCFTMGGDICEAGEDCKDGVLVEASDTGGQATCCTQGGRCIPKVCHYSECEEYESCSGEMFETSDVKRCCDGTCLKSCTSQPPYGYGGTICNSTLACDGSTREATDTTRCCIGKCKEPSVFPWLTILIILLIVGVVITFFLFIRKRRKPKPAPARLEFSGMIPTRPMPGRIPMRARIPTRMPMGKPLPKKPKPTKPIPRKPVKPKPKLPPVPKPSA